MKLTYILQLPIILFLSACGGGGGGNSNSLATPASGFYGQQIPLAMTQDGPGEKYSGINAQAVINDENANQILASFLGFDILTPTSDTLNRNRHTSSTLDTAEHLDQAKILQSFRGKQKGLASKAFRYTEKEIISGSISGTLETIISSEDDITGTVTSTWTDYNNGDGITLNGKSVFKVVGAYVNGDIYFVSDTTEVLESFRVDYDSHHIIQDGLIRKHFTEENGRLTTTTLINIDEYDSRTNYWISFDDFKIIKKPAFDKHIFYEGRFYHSEYGYMDMETIENFTLCNSFKRYCHDGVPFADGEMKITGNNSDFQLSIVHVNNPGGFYFSEQDFYAAQIVVNNEVNTPLVYEWDNLTGQPLVFPPRIPNVILSLNPTNNAYTNTPLEVTYETYYSGLPQSVVDPESTDYDINVTFNWKVNDQLVPNQNNSILAPEHFNPTDKVTVTVIASNARASSETSVSITIKYDPIFQSSSTILYELGFDDIYALKAKDINGDNLKDIVFLHRGTDGLKLNLIFQNIDGTFSNRQVYDSIDNQIQGYRDEEIFFEDFNQDGLPEIIVYDSNSLHQKIGLFKLTNEGTLELTDTFTSFSDDSISAPHNIHIADISGGSLSSGRYGDGVPDIIFSRLLSEYGAWAYEYDPESANSIQILSVNPDLTFSDQTYDRKIIDGYYEYDDIAIMDTNQDNNLDILLLYENFDTITIRNIIRENSASDLLASTNHTISDDVSTNILYTADFNKDSLTDMVLHSQDGGRIFYQLGTGGFIDSGLLFEGNFTNNRPGEYQAVSAVYGEDALLVQSKWPNTKIRIYSFQNDEYKLIKEDRSPVWEDDHKIIADINNDGLADIIYLDDRGFSIQPSLVISYGL